MLANFQKGKATQERLIVKCFLVSESESQLSLEVMHTVVSVIHEIVYTTICSHIQQKKSMPTEVRNTFCCQVG